MYTSPIFEARSHNHCCRGKATSIRYYECASVLGADTQMVYFLRRIILFHIINGTTFEKELQNVCFDFLHNLCPKHF